MIANDCIDLIQGSPEWITARLGFVSASNIDSVMSKGKSGEAIGRKKYKTRLVAERLTGQPVESYSNDAMAWGVQTEGEARMAYEAATGTFVDQTGFWKHPEIQWVGCSPDGLIGEDGGCEYKCPNTTTHLDYLFTQEIPSDYYKQIQMNLWVTGRKWWDFCSYDPRLPEKNRLFIKRVERDNPMIEAMELEVKQFLKEVEELIIKLGE